MTELRLGIVGAGYWARSAHLPSLKGHPGARWSAIASSRRASADEVARAFDIEIALDDWRALVQHPEVDAVVVAAPAALHHAVALACLTAGKPVLCEAPLGLDAAQGSELVLAAERAGVANGYVRPRPFLYGGAEVRELCDGGTLGRLESALFTWRGNPWLRADPKTTWRTRADAGPPVLAGVAIAVVASILGPIAEVAARSSRVSAQPFEGVVPAHDHLAGRLTTRSKVEVALDAGHSYVDAPANGLALFGSEASLRWEWSPRPRILLARKGSREWESLAFSGEPDLARAWTFTRDFATAIRSGSAACPDFRAGLAELLALDALAASSARGGAPVEVASR